MRAPDFILPINKVYMCGHSLGPMPRTAQQKVDQAVKNWGHYAVQAWNQATWIDLSEQVAVQIAPLIGATATEVIISDSTSINLFKVLMSALSLQPKRKVILTTTESFPADLYIAQGIAQLDPTISLKRVNPHQLLEHLDETIAVLLLEQVHYRNASMHDIAFITAYAHRFGIVVVWDLSHSVGLVPLQLNTCEVDFAVGCTYKYLNGGPGSPAFIYVNQRHHTQIKSPIQGWMGHEHPFAFHTNYHSSGNRQFYGGTPAILSLSALAGALAIFDGIKLSTLYELSQSYSLELINALEQLNLAVLSPKKAARGGHVALYHPAGYALSRALIDQGIICDYRAPHLIRVCVNPLYLSLKDIQRCSYQIQMILQEKIYQLPQYQTPVKVT